MKENAGIKRLQHIDSLKGIAVLLVIASHCQIFSAAIGKMILAFHMPLFFFISGYLFKHTNTFSRETTSVLIRKFKQLIVPYFIFECINLALSLLIRPFYGNLIHESLVMQSIILCINTPDYDGICLRLWFLPSAFVSSLYMLLCAKMRFRFKISETNYYFTSAVMFLAISFISKAVILSRLPFTMDISVMAAAYMCLGFSCKEKLEMVSEMEKWKLSILSIILFAILWLCSQFNSGYFMYANSYGNYGLAIPGSIAGIILSVFFVHIFNIKGMFLEWLGKNSLLIFPLHLDILFFLKWFVNGKLNWGG